MKILRICTRLNVGGPSLQVLNLNKELYLRGHRTFLIAGTCPDDEGRYFEDRAREQEYFPVRFLDDLRREINPKKDLKVFRLLVDNFKINSYDIIHSHMSKAGLLTRLAALWVRLRYGKKPKLVHTFHGHVFHGYFGRWKSRLFVLLERLMARWTDALVAVSEGQKRELVEDYKIAPESKVRVVPLGFDLEPFLKLMPFRYDKYKHRTLRVGIVGRVTAVKNHGLFIDFVRGLNKVGVSAHPYVIGNGELFNSVQNTVFYWNIPPFSGRWVPHYQMPVVYSTLDVVVCSSLNEGTPVSLIEAMAAGRLVVSTPVGGVPDLIGERGERGLYLYPDRLEKSAEDLMTWIEGGYYEATIYRAREYVRKEHSLERLVDDIEKLYGEI